MQTKAVKMIQGKWGLEEKLNGENLSTQKDGDLYGPNLKMLTKVWGKKEGKGERIGNTIRNTGHATKWWSIKTFKPTALS